jgi:hypothetical protein
MEVSGPLPQVTEHPDHSVQSAHCGTEKTDNIYIMFTIILSPIMTT